MEGYPQAKIAQSAQGFQIYRPHLPQYNGDISARDTVGHTSTSVSCIGNRRDDPLGLGLADSPCLSPLRVNSRSYLSAKKEYEHRLRVGQEGF